MTRHLADHPKTASTGRMKRFLALDRATAPEGSHPAVQDLIKRPRSKGGPNRRLAEFLRIARGLRA